MRAPSVPRSARPSLFLLLHWRRVEGEQQPEVVIRNNQLYINNRRAETYPSWHEWDVPHEELYLRAFQQQRQALDHNQLVDAFRMVLCAVSVTAAAALFTLWRACADHR